MHTHSKICDNEPSNPGMLQKNSCANNNKNLTHSFNLDMCHGYYPTSESAGMSIICISASAQASKQKVLR